MRLVTTTTSKTTMLRYSRSKLPDRWQVRSVNYSSHISFDLHWNDSWQESHKMMGKYRVLHQVLFTFFKGANNCNSETRFSLRLSKYNFFYAYFHFLFRVCSFAVWRTLEWDDFPKSFQNRLLTSLVIPIGTQSYHKKLWPTGLHTRLPIGGQSFTTMAIK